MHALQWVLLLCMCIYLVWQQYFLDRISQYIPTIITLWIKKINIIIKGPIPSHTHPHTARYS